MDLSSARNRLALFAILWLLIAAVGARAEAEEEEGPPPSSFAELEERLAQILEETHTPGLGIVVVSPEEVLWTAGVGKADVASGRPATPETLFRIGSTSKGFVSLAVLKLQEEGRLSLDDTLASHAPEIEFENRWEETDPVRLVHLLEHSSGFDDIHLAEYASNDPRPVTLREGLDLHPDSRIARWRPGTRFSYCNSGPALAAYVVEKVTGQRFEDYVEGTFFEPLAMTTASYFLSPDVERDGATVYQNDGETPNPYWHISVRPSGAINASARDMAGYLRFYLQRGSLDGELLLSPASIDRMEKATTTWGAEAGLEAGYGLGNYTSTRDGFVFHGHNGGVNGGLTEMAYLPEHGLGYAFMINSGNGAAFVQISELVQKFLVRELPEPQLAPAVAVPSEVAETYTGYYQPASPRAELQHFIDRLGGQVRLSVDGERLEIKSLLSGDPVEYTAVTDRTARLSESSPTSLALLPEVEDAIYIEAEGQTFRKIPGWLAWGQIAWLLAVVVLMLSSVLFALVWLPRRFFGKLKGRPGLGARAWPFLATLAFVAFAVIFLLGMADPIEQLGKVGAYSLGQMLLSVVFALTALWSLFVVLRSRRASTNRVAWCHSLLVAAACSSLMLYLLYWGMIGWRSWSY
jgi:CubicO group peptidase (beta-lactamase class C family)